MRVSQKQLPAAAATRARRSRRNGGAYRTGVLAFLTSVLLAVACCITTVPTRAAQQHPASDLGISIADALALLSDTDPPRRYQRNDHVDYYVKSYPHDPATGEPVTWGPYSIARLVETNGMLSAVHIDFVFYFGKLPDFAVLAARIAPAIETTLAVPTGLAELSLTLGGPPVPIDRFAAPHATRWLLAHLAMASAVGRWPARIERFVDGRRFIFEYRLYGHTRIDLAVTIVPDNGIRPDMPDLAFVPADERSAARAAMTAVENADYARAWSTIEPYMTSGNPWVLTLAAETHIFVRQPLNSPGIEDLWTSAANAGYPPVQLRQELHRLNREMDLAAPSDTGAAYSPALAAMAASGYLPAIELMAFRDDRAPACAELAAKQGSLAAAYRIAVLRGSHFAKPENLDRSTACHWKLVLQRRLGERVSLLGSERLGAICKHAAEETGIAIGQFEARAATVTPEPFQKLKESYTANHCFEP